jgi:hypothetical protein
MGKTQSILGTILRRLCQKQQKNEFRDLKQMGRGELYSNSPSLPLLF